MVLCASYFANTPYVNCLAIHLSRINIRFTFTIGESGHFMMPTKSPVRNVRGLCILFQTNSIVLRFL